MLVKLILLFTVGAAADITTSFWQPGTTDESGRYTFVASVVGASDSLTTLAYSVDNDTSDVRPDESSYRLGKTWTMTVGPEHYEWSSPNVLLDPDGSERSTTADFSYKNICHRKARDDEDAECTESYGLDYARVETCELATYEPSTYTQLYTYTHSTAGRTVATVVAPFPGKGSTYVPPDWCSQETITSLPEEDLLSTTTYPAASVYSYRVVITAGEEKLSATAGARDTGLAVPMRTAAPALAGLGAAVAAFML